jgi:nitroreductase
MDFMELVRIRQSNRKYLPRPVARSMIESCLEAARLAPSACNSEPWSFIVVDDPELKTTLADKAFSGIYSMNRFAERAPVLIAVITERSRFAASLGRYFRGTRYNLIDIGIACEHLVLRAAEAGLGTCWLGWFNERGVKKILGLPRSTKVDILISLGYPEDASPRDKKRRPLEEIFSYASSVRPKEAES